MNFLGAHNVRDIRNLELAHLRRLEHFLKGLQIHVQLGPNGDHIWARPKTVRGLVRSGGSHAFMKDNIEMTVKVNDVIHVLESCASI